MWKDVNSEDWHPPRLWYSYIQYIYTYIHIYTCTYMQSEYVGIYIYICIWIHIHTNTSVQFGCAQVLFKYHFPCQNKGKKLGRFRKCPLGRFSERFTDTLGVAYRCNSVAWHQWCHFVIFLKVICIGKVVEFLRLLWFFFVSWPEKWFNQMLCWFELGCEKECNHRVYLLSRKNKSEQHQNTCLFWAYLQDTCIER